MPRNGSTRKEDYRMFSLQFDMSNDAFNHDARPEHCAVLLREIAEKLDRHITGGIIRDDNGNTIGIFETSEE